LILRPVQFVLFDVLFQPAQHLTLLAVLHLSHNFIEGEVHHIVVMKLLGGHVLAEPQPDLVDQLDFAGCQVRSVRAKKKEFSLAGVVKYLQVEPRARIGQALSGQPNLAGLLMSSPLRRPAENNGG